MKTSPFIFYYLLVILCGRFELHAQTFDSTKNTLEKQQDYIRNLVQQQKKIILNNSFSADADTTINISKELQTNQLAPLDSFLLKKVKPAQVDALALKNALNDKSSKKSHLKRAFIIGGISGGSIAGALAYFLTRSSGSKPNTEDNISIDDKPPMHP